MSEIRSPQKILSAWESATKDKPLFVLTAEIDNFIKAMRLSYDNAQPLRGAIIDKDRLLANGIASPIDKSMHTNRRTWKEHLKANGCVEIGNDFNKSTGKKPLEGNFDCRKELTEATNRVWDKYNG